LFIYYQTHEHDSLTWRQVFTSTVPTVGANAQMVYDRDRQRIVMFGGVLGIGGWSTNTWEYDGIDWSLRTSATPVTVPHGGVFHDRRRTVVSFGNRLFIANSLWNNDLWEWNGVSWQQIPTANTLASGSVSYTGVVYDPIRDVIVVSGRVDWDPRTGRPTPVPGTWEWDAVRGWVEVLNAGGPLTYRVLAYDRARGVQILLDNTSTWERTNGTWIVRGPMPIMSGLIMANDSRRARIFANATNGSGWYNWIYAPLNPASYEPHGQGCPGSLGTPSLDLATTWGLPWLGGALEVRLSGLPAGIALVVTGTSDIASPYGPLPLDLGALGMPGCSLRASPDTTQLVAGSPTTAVHVIPVPNRAALIGQVLYQQAFVPDPAAGNPARATASDSRRLVLGVR
jgi:hypothetical protein